MNQEPIQWTKLINNDQLKLAVLTKTAPTKGNIVYEYNPFYNYRIQLNMYEYKDGLYSLADLWNNFKITLKCTITKDLNGNYSITANNSTSFEDYLKTIENILEAYKDGHNIDRRNLEKALKETSNIFDSSELGIDLKNNWISWGDDLTTETNPFLREAGELTDFITDELSFDLEHPVSILPQYSYDGSVNLILNDGKNNPKLINSRFSATGRNTYEVCDRKGNNDTNIYDQGELFEIDTSLYKQTESIAKVDFLGVSYGGNLKVGNYHFYFKVADADGNESDFIAESGVVSVFLGSNSYSSVSTGERNENSHKQVLFQLSNLDSSYSYVHVYYSRYTAENNLNRVMEYNRIDKNYIINNAQIATILITGYEKTVGVTANDINLLYNLVDSAYTQAICLNRLFMANVHKPDIPYTELQDLSLRIYPYLNTEAYDGDVDENYSFLTSSKGYLDPKYIYEKTGYWTGELYRFGIVYIMSDNTLSPVFNIRGGCNIGRKGEKEGDFYTKIDLYENGKRKYITYSEENYLIITENNIDNFLPGLCLFENVKGVVSFNCEEDTNVVYSVHMNIPYEVKLELSKYVKGYFFVRLARIPFKLAQGITIGINKESGTPTIPTKNGIVDEVYKEDLSKTHVCVEGKNDEVVYLSEGFLSRYKFKFKEKSSSIWKKIGKVVGIALAIVAAAVATVYTCGAAGVVFGALAASIAPAAVGGVTAGAVIAGTATVSAIAVGITAASVVAAAGIAAGVVTGLVGAGAELVNVLNRGFARHRSKSYNRWNTIVPNGYYIQELDDSRLLTHDFDKRIILTASDENYVAGIICPDYELDLPHFNSIFVCDEHLIENTITLSINILNEVPDNYFTNNGRHFYMPSYFDSPYRNSITAKIVPLTDNLKIAAIEDMKFRARAGEPEEVFRIESVGSSFRSNESKSTSVEDGETIDNRKVNSDIIRGSFGPFLGFYNKTSDLLAGTLVNIYTAGYDAAKMENYVYQRACDDSTFYAISDRIELSKEQSISILGILDTSDINLIVYRGDCYLCQFTHRINRNFQDPSALFNDKIVEENTWKDNYEPHDSGTLGNINLGDVNAVQLGTWVTFKVRSSNNLNIRTLDYSWVEESAMTNHPRTYYPKTPMSVEGTYKTPEAAVFNAGFKKTLSERYNFAMFDVPWVKNWFGTRIMYSNVNVSDSFLNGFRVFKGANYRDYTREYGEIVKLISFESSLLCVFEHGVALIPVNERAVAAEGAGGYAYINTSNVLPENPKILSDVYGSQWADSVIKVPGKFGDNTQYVYGVDTVAKKIWRTDGNTLTCISDNKVQEFLNNNITLSESELTPKIGIRNVKTFYNAFKRDVLFTFYDNTYGFEEKVWNLCWNELMQLFVTFYSWVPSVMENINNIPFSFNRNTTKWLAKLGTSHTGNSFADGITLTNVVINNEKNDDGAYVDSDKYRFNYTYTTVDGDSLDINLEVDNGYRNNFIGVLTLSNRTIPELNGVPQISYSLERDPWHNYELFRVKPIKVRCIDYPNLTNRDSLDGKLVLPSNYGLNPKQSKFGGTVEFYGLYLVGNIYDIMSELYYRNRKGIARADKSENKLLDYFNSDEKITNILLYFKKCIKENYPIFKDSKGYRPNLENPINMGNIVRLLNIKATIKYLFKDEGLPLGDDYYNIAAGYESGTSLIDAGYYQSTVAVIPKWNLLFLSTDFWKHGLAGIIDIADKIYPTYWYGLLHPFEFEFIVADLPGKHKIFDNLLIISNKAEPESFHYEIVGECYDFAKDKKNMYIRQEATKELYLYNGSDITYNHDYTDLEECRRDVVTGQESTLKHPYSEKGYDKSTIFPLYYGRQDHINEIYDSYLRKEGNDAYDYSALAGAELILYNNLNEIRIRNNCEAVNMDDFYKGRLRGNMRYKEDIWNVLINPINFILKNEPNWEECSIIEGKSNLVPIEPTIFAIPDDIKDKKQDLELPQGYERGITIWEDKTNKEVKVKDKYLKVRIRYSGKDLAIIHAINTLYTISYS